MIPVILHIPRASTVIPDECRPDFMIGHEPLPWYLAARISSVRSERSLSHCLLHTALVQSREATAVPMAIALQAIQRGAQMARIIEKELTPDDPIFSSGSEIFVPVSRPPAGTGMPSMDGGQPQSPPPEDEERLATEWNSLRLERYRRLQERLASTGSLAPTQPSSASSSDSPPQTGSTSGGDPRTST